MDHESRPPTDDRNNPDQPVHEPLADMNFAVNEAPTAAANFDAGIPHADMILADDDRPTAAAIVKIELTPFESAEWMNTPAETYEDAVEAVEFFLEAQAGLIAKSHQTWREVKALQGKITANIAELQEEREREANKNVPGVSERQLRRHAERNAAVISFQSVGHRRNTADKLFKDHVLPQLGFWPDQEEAEDEAALAAIPQIAGQCDLQEIIEAYGESLAADIAKELVSYMKADYYDARLIAYTKRFLRRKPLVPIFLDRLMEMGELAPKGIVDYPGYLEVLGTHEKQQRNRGIVAEAARNIPADPEDYAHEFLQGLLDGDIKPVKRQEMAAAIEIMKLIGSQIMEGEFKVDNAGYIERLSSHWRAWPPLMVSELERFTNNSATQSRQDLEAMLSTFARRGRLPATGHVVKVSNKQVKPAKGKQAKRGDGSPQIKRQGEDMIIETAAKGVAMDDLVATTGETEREPLKHFAVLRSTGSSSGKTFWLERHPDIGSLMSCNEINGYIEAHNGSDNLAASIRAALERLAANPDDEAAKRYQGVYFSLQAKPGQKQIRGALQRARRLSLQHFPGVAGGSITSKTRIIYGLVRLKNKQQGEDELVLAIHGAFLKQDLDGQGMPKRRH